MSCEGYFYYHSIGQYPGKEAELAAAMTEFAALWAACDNDQWGRMLEGRAEYLALWAGLLGVEAQEITAVENVTQGFHAALTGLPERHLKGRKLLIAADCFPSVHFLLAGLAPRLGFELVTVPLREGESWVRDEDLLAAWDAQVGVAILTQVTSTASYACDLPRLTAHGRERGSLIGLDFTQAAGLLPFPSGETRPDFAVSTSLKWLCGPPGAGALWMAAPHIAEAEPELRGWFSQPDPFNWDIARFSYAPDARRFDHGTPGIVSALAALPALRWHAAQDRARLCAQTYARNEEVMEVARRHGLPLASPEDASRRGGSVMLRLPGHVDPGALAQGLRARGVIADTRGPVLRLSAGAVTTGAGVARLEEALTTLLAA